MFGVINLNDSDYKVSAIVLVYNGEKFLRECIDSLVNQTLEGLEIILVDDVSTDDSLYICKEFERDYDNVRIIQKEVNGGLASSANLGIQNAKGEYVILVDNDDIVPKEAYEKLYNKAKETDSDVVVGKANFLRGRYQFEMTNYEGTVWENERTFSPIDFPRIFHETFYWNKLIKKRLLIDNDIQLPVDVKVYADRKFSHTVMTYAKKVSIITDCVYIWRIRKNVLDESLSMRRKEAWNYIDRIDSFQSGLDHLTNFYKDYFKILMRRVVLPVEGILSNQEFEDVYFDIGPKILAQEFEKMDDPYDNDLKNYDNLLIYLTLNKRKKEIKELLESNLLYQREIYNENGKSYWKLPLFRNENVDIPDSLFEINFMAAQFLNIDKVVIDNSFIHFQNIRIPKYFDMDKGFILFKGATDFEGIAEENKLSYELNKIDEDENVYDLKVPVDDFANFERFNVYFKSYSSNGIHQFRLHKSNFKEEVENSFDGIKFLFTNNDAVSVISQQLNNIFKLDLTEDKLKINFKSDVQIKKPLIMFVVNNKTKAKTRLDFDEEKVEFSLDWKFFLDKKSKYELTLMVYNDYGYVNKIRLNDVHLADFNEKTITYEGIKVKPYKTKFDNINLSTF